MKNFGFEIDRAKGVDLMRAKDHKIIAHLDSYEEAAAMLVGRNDLYIRYYAKKAVSKETA